CRHNEVYWSNHAYYGFGVGAARYVGGKRELNVRGLNDYIKRILSGTSPIFQSEQLAPEDRARETAVIQLRRSAGIQRATFEHPTGYDLDLLLGPKLAWHISAGLLEDVGDSVRLTRRGKCVADALVADLL